VLNVFSASRGSVQKLTFCCVFVAVGEVSKGNGWSDQRDELALRTTNVERSRVDSSFVMSVSDEVHALVRSRRQAPTETEMANIQLTYVTFGTTTLLHLFNGLFTRTT